MSDYLTLYPNQVTRPLNDKKSPRNPTRILRPFEFELLLEASKTEENQLRLEVALITGMRYQELRRFHGHPEWYDEYGNFVDLPYETKVYRGKRGRYIRLPNIAKEVIPRFFELKLKFPVEQTWRENLRRWALKAGLDPIWLNSKTTRKTWECWLVNAFPDRIVEILKSQGHTERTALEHYLGIPLSSEDLQMVKKWIDGW